MAKIVKIPRRRPAQTLPEQTKNDITIAMCSAEQSIRLIAWDAARLVQDIERHLGILGDCIRMVPDREALKSLLVEHAHLSSMLRDAKTKLASLGFGPAVAARVPAQLASSLALSSLGETPAAD